MKFNDHLRTLEHGRQPLLVHFRCWTLQLVKSLIYSPSGLAKKVAVYVNDSSAVVNLTWKRLFESYGFIRLLRMLFFERFF